MVEITEQFCIKSYEVTDEKGSSFRVNQGDIYTTSVPKDNSSFVIVFSDYWVSVPKDHFVECEYQSRTIAKETPNNPR